MKYLIFTLSMLVLGAQRLPISSWKEPSETKGCGVWELSLLIPQAEFTPETITSLSQRLLREDSGEYRFVSFTFGSIEGGLYDYQYRPHTTYERTLDYFKR